MFAETEKEGPEMDKVRIAVSGMELDFATARRLAQALAEAGSPEAELIAWADAGQGTHSPSCVKCQIGDKAGWEVYGANHGGRLRIDINDGAYVLIYS
ncbi:MAG: AF1514 family protein [Thermodesulfobacteriota bacterium]